MAGYGTLTIAWLTLYEARRRKILLAAVVLGAAFLAVFSIALYFFEREYRSGGAFSAVEHRAIAMMLTLGGLYAVNFLTMAAAVLLSVDTLSGEIDSGVIETLASKPLRRRDILVGKWAAYWLLTCAYLLLMAGGVVLLVRAFTGFVQPNMERALPLMLLEATVLLTVSIAGGTRLSTVTNGIVAFGFYGLAFVGGLVEQIGAFTASRAAREIGTAVSLLSPTDALWRMAAYYLEPPIVRDLQLGPLMTVSASAPTAAMVIWSIGFVLVGLAWAVRQFDRRAL